MGLSKDDKREIELNAHLFVSNAADVKWDTPLAEAMESNMDGALKIMDLAKGASKVDHFMHISTVAIQSGLGCTLEEKIYDPGVDGPQYLKSLHEGSEKYRDEEEKKVMGKFGSTYTFSKCLAESALHA